MIIYRLPHGDKITPTVHTPPLAGQGVMTHVFSHRGM